MFLGLGMTAAGLLLTGGMLSACASAIRRQDGPSVLAMAGAAIVSGHLGGIPRELLAIACLVVAVAIAASIGAVVLTAAGGRGSAFRSGAIGTCGTLFALFLASSSAPDTARPLSWGAAIDRAIATSMS